MKAKTIRRIIGITALVLWVVAVVSRIVLGDHDDRLAWQLDHWSMLFAPALTAGYSILLTIHLAKRQHWYVKLGYILVCIMVVLFCFITFLFAGVFFNHKVWGNKDYVVYSEFDGFIEPNQLVLYRRDGLVGRKMYCLRGEEMGHEEKVEYTMYDSLDLIKENASYTVFFTDDSICHRTIFYRMDDGKRYEETVNDSLQELIR